MSIRRITNKMDMDMLVLEREKGCRTWKIPANSDIKLDLWTPWVDNQAALTSKSIVIIGSNPAASVGFSIFEHQNKLYLGVDFDTRIELPGKNGGKDEIELIIEGHKIRGE